MTRNGGGREAKSKVRSTTAVRLPAFTCFKERKGRAGITNNKCKPVRDCKREWKRKLIKAGTTDTFTFYNFFAFLVTKKVKTIPLIVVVHD